MKRIATFCLSTLQKEIRNKMIWAFLLAALVWPLVEGRGGNLGLFYGFLFLSSSLLAAIIAVGLIDEKKVLGQLLAPPVAKYEYLLGKLLGGLILVLMYFFYMSVLSNLWFFQGSHPIGKSLLFTLNMLPVLLSVLVWGMFFSLFFDKIPSLLCLIVSSGVSFLAGVKSIRILNGVSDIDLMGAIAFLFFAPFSSSMVGMALGADSFLDRVEPLSLESTNTLFVTHYCLSFVGMFILVNVIFYRKK